MVNWRFLLVGSILAATLTGCCCCPCDAVLPQAEFTTGDFPDVPVYPGATLTTETDAVISAAVLATSFVVEEGEWKHYISTDSSGAILDWYAGVLPDYGWLLADIEDVNIENGLVFASVREPSMALLLFTLPDLEGGDRTHLVVGRVRIPIQIEE
jgi:hypothetical protein